MVGFFRIKNEKRSRKTMSTKLFSKLKLTFAAALTILLLNGCKEDAVQPGADSDNLDFSAVSSSSVTSSSAIILEINVVKVLIKDIKLNVSGSNENTVNYKTGPLVLNLDFKNNVNFVSSAYIAAGTYDRVKFEIHKLSDNEPAPDPEFIDASGRYSIIVKGRVNGASFVFKSSMSSHQIVAFQNSLVVTAQGKSNITLQANPYIWFVKAGLFIDPLDEANRTDIELNIKNNINNNIRVFVDNDMNGQPD